MIIDCVALNDLKLLKVTEIKFARWKKKSLGIAHALFQSKADALTAMKRNKDKLGDRYVELFFQVCVIF